MKREKVRSPDSEKTSKSQWCFQSSVGPIYLVASPAGLSGIFWRASSDPLLRSLDGSDATTKILLRTVRQLEEYFAGRRTEFDLPLDVKGTEFQTRVWRELSRIPYGQTLSYRDIARKLRQETAARAVGTTNGRNPISIVVPCHRVIAANGGLGGYAGGLEIKQKLLALERSRVSAQPKPKMMPASLNF